MSENTNTTPTYLGTSKVNQAVEFVMDLIDSQDYFAKIRRGALGTEPGLCCEVAPSTAYMWLRGERNPKGQNRLFIKKLVKKYFNESVPVEELFS